MTMTPEKTMDLIVVAFANKRNAHTRNYLTSLYRNGYKKEQTHLVGDGVKWISFMTKIESCYHYLSNLRKSGKITDQTVVCMTDCFDVLCVAPKEELISKYQRLTRGGTIIFGSEGVCLENCKPLTRWWSSPCAQFQNPSNAYLNGGFYMGKWIDLEFCLSYVMISGHSDDQLALCEFAEKFPNKVLLDTNCELVGNIGMLRFKDHLFHCSKGRVIYSESDTYPCFIHMPGMNLDLQFRTDYFGEYVLQDSYESIPLHHRIQGINNKGVFGTVVLLVVFLLCPVLLFPFLFGVLYYTRFGGFL